MKKNNLLPSLAIAIAAVIISSCSSEKGLTVEKRHYRKGYSVSWNNGKNETHQKSKIDDEQVTTSENLAEAKPVEATVKSEIEITEPVLVASSEKTPQVINANESNADVVTAKSAETIKADNISGSKNESSTVAKKYTRDDRKEMRKFLHHKAPGETDIPLWAYILLAIFIPPLAVALYEGIHGPFWLSLILTLCFWVPGVIYALWRVLRNN